MEVALMLVFSFLCCTSAAPQLPVTVNFETCVLPTTQICAVNYLVPPSIAQLASVLEAEIKTAYDSDVLQGNSVQCALSLRAVRCAKRFPRCSNDSTNVTVTSLDCAQRLKCATSQTIKRLNDEYFCSLKETTVPNGDYKSATNYGYAFNYCAVDANWLVTEWMFLLLKYEDTYLSSPNVLGAGGFLALNYPACTRDYIDYGCRKIGQCDSNGHVSINYTRQQCEQAVSCYPTGYVDSTPCNVWPLITAAAPTVATTVTTYTYTTMPTATASNAKQSATTVPTGGTLMLPVAGSSHAVEVSLPTCACLLVFLALLLL